MKFIDEVNITVSSGHGGPGCISFRRETKVPRGGPDGGDGGKGGDVVFQTNSRVHSLLDLRFKKKYQAKNGLPGRGSLQSGADGENLVVEVPKGTVIRTSEGQMIADLGLEDRVIVAKGGIGGKGNHFYKSSINQAPEKAQKGMGGEEFELHIELKILADVGIIGFPNAGKSTLISKISAARPKVADYPFTTLVPNLGVVQVEEGVSLVVADIPGLVKDAHKGTGLGMQFLRHIERTRIFVHLIDASGFSQRDPVEDYLDINNELIEYDKIKAHQEGFSPLSRRKQLVYLSKVDTIDEERHVELKENFRKIDVEVGSLSAATGLGVKELIYRLAKEVFSNE